MGVSNVRNMYGMFLNCHKFNCDLSGWDVSNVVDIHNMFYGCKNFNSDLSKWDVSMVRDMTSMFKKSGMKVLPNWYKE